MAVAKINNKIVAPVVEKKVPETRFGVSLDNFLSNVSEYGTVSPSPIRDFIVPGLKEVGYYDLAYRFVRGYYLVFERSTQTTPYYVAFPDLETVDVSGLEGTFSAGYLYDSAVDGVPDLIVSFPKLTKLDKSRGLYGFMSGSARIIRQIDFPVLATISGNYSMQEAFACAGALGYSGQSLLQSISFPALTTISGAHAWESCFSSQTALKSISLPVLAAVTGAGSMVRAFKGCISLETMVYPALTTVGRYSMQNCHQDNTALTNISFPALTTPDKDAFGGYASGYIFKGCTALTEIHFRADAQAAIEAMTGYADKWGATNATILFDL